MTVEKTKFQKFKMEIVASYYLIPSSLPRWFGEGGDEDQFSIHTIQLHIAVCVLYHFITRYIDTKTYVICVVTMMIIS